jgi:SAM-dependent methyltransferase
VDRATQLALNAINRQFYASLADEFSASRRHDWPGFHRVIARVDQRNSMQAPLRVLDVGAGDGRFAACLQNAWSGPIDYVGIDACHELLARARARELGSDFRFHEADLIESPLTAALPEGEFDLIALFGVLHHVPGREFRAALLRALADRVSTSGVLAITFWRLDEDPRFASRVVASNREWSLEPGDTLLRWGAADAPPRFCHFPDAAEIEALIAATNLHALDRFRADGRSDQLNEYALLTRCPA